MGTTVDPATEDVTASWGALVAQRFKADYQVLAWTGAQQAPHNLSNTSDIAPPLLRLRQPVIPQLFQELVAADDTSRGFNTSLWVPQVCMHMYWASIALHGC